VAHKHTIKSSGFQFPFPFSQRVSSAAVIRGIETNLAKTCVYTVDSQNYWIFGRCPSYGILETRKHNVSEAGSVSVLR
jgi:hypothetical protein